MSYAKYKNIETISAENEECDSRRIRPFIVSNTGNHSDGVGIVEGIVDYLLEQGSMPE
jgi:hypothetical protein